MFRQTPPRETDGPPGGVDRSSIDRAGAAAAIQDHLARMVHARDAHMQAVDAEAAGSKTIHSLTRHGAQTGWAAQLLRICTKLTPDQPYDEHGMLPIGKVLQEHTKTRKKGNEEVTYRLKHRTGGGIAAGVFYSPEVQNRLVASAMQTVHQRVRPFPFCEVQWRDGKTRWVPYDFIHVYAVAGPGGSGVAYIKRPDFVKLEPAVVVAAIEDFLHGRTLKQRAMIDLARQRGFTGEDWQVDDFLAGERHRPGAAATLRMTPDGVRFRTWGDLLDFLRVRQILRNGARTEISLKQWNSPKILTMMPETVHPMDAGFAPTSFVAENQEERNLLKSCIWTGGLMSQDKRRTVRVVPPSWARAWPA